MIIILDLFDIYGILIVMINTKFLSISETFLIFNLNFTIGKIDVIYRQGRGKRNQIHCHLEEDEPKRWLLRSLINRYRFPNFFIAVIQTTKVFVSFFY